MDSLLLSALIAAAPLPAAAGPAEDPAALDVACYRLMASLAEDEHARMRTAARIAASYFLGRLDAHGAAFDAGEDGTRRDATLLPRCAAALEAGGQDFRRLGELLAPQRQPSV